jgi:uncharacterized cupin superfamily protein
VRRGARAGLLVRERPPVDWAECAVEQLRRGSVQARITDLGAAAGSVTTGLKRIAIAPGALSSPVHVHGAEEEIFFVLDGSGVSWQDGETFEVGPGDCLVHLPGGGRADPIAHIPGGEAHTLVAGAEGLDVLAYGSRAPDEACYLPRADVAWLGASWTAAGDGPHPYDREAGAGPLDLPAPSPRPPRIVALERVEVEAIERAGVRRRRRDLGRAAGSAGLGLQHVTVEPFGLSTLPHCHAAEEEIFVVLSGRGSCVLGDADHAVRRGSVVARPAGTGMPHTFRADEGGLELLAFGERRPWDYVFYARSGVVHFKAAGLWARLEAADLWTAEEGAAP